MMSTKKTDPGDIFSRLGGGGVKATAKNKAPKVTLVPVKRSTATPKATPKAAPKPKSGSSTSVKKTTAPRYSTKPGKIAGTPPPKPKAKPKASTKPGKIAGTPPPKKATAKPKPKAKSGTIAPMVDNGNTAADASVRTWANYPKK